MLGELLPSVPYVGGGIWASGVPAEHGGHPALLEAGLDGRPRKEEGPMRGLEKKLHLMAQTSAHGDSMTNSTQWGQVGEN